MTTPDPDAFAFAKAMRREGPGPTELAECAQHLDHLLRLVVASNHLASIGLCAELHGDEPPIEIAAGPAFQTLEADWTEPATLAHLVWAVLPTLHRLEMAVERIRGHDEIETEGPTLRLVR